MMKRMWKKSGFERRKKMRRRRKLSKWMKGRTEKRLV